MRTSLTILGVAAGVALAVAISVINATLVASVRATAREIAGAAELEVAASDRTGLPIDQLTKVEAVEGVDRAVPVLRDFASLRGRDGAGRTMIVGITPEFTSLFPDNLGRLGSVEVEGGFGSGGGVLLAADAARRLGLRSGDSAILETPNGYQPVPVTGLVDGDALDAFNGGGVGFMLLPAAQELFERPQRVDSIYVITNPDADLAAVEDLVRGNVSSGAIVGEPGIRSNGYTDSLEGINALTSIAGTVALFVAGFLVFNTMSMSFAERRREISLAITFGATRRQIFTAFLGEALVFGIVASIVGTFLGIQVARLLLDQAMEALRVFDITATPTLQVRVKDILLGDLSGVTVAVLGALLPARRILNLAPIESLRPRGSYEISPQAEPRARAILRVVAGLILLAASVAVLAVVPEDARDIGWLTNAGLIMGLVGATLVLPSIIPNALEGLRPLVASAFRAPGRLAIDALKKNRARTTVTVGALMFTLAIVVSVASAIGSFEAEWNKTAQLWFGAPLYVNARSAGTLGSDQPLPAETEALLERADGVHGVFPERYRVVNIDGRQTVLYVVPAVQATAERARYGEVGAAYRREVAEHLAAGEIMISSFMAEQRDLSVGDTVGIPTPSGKRELRVGGLFPDLNTLDSLYIDASQFVRYWKDDRVDRFEVSLQPGADPDVVAGRLRDAIADAGVPAEVVTRQALIGDLFDSVERVLSVARAIQLAALVVATLAIANTMLIAVYDRRWELGLQQAIGMGRGQMLQSLLLEAGVIGIVGGAGAALIGMGMGFMMLQGMTATYNFDVAYQPSWTVLMLAVLTGAAIAALAAFYPTRASLRVPIIEALRYE